MALCMCMCGGGTCVIGDGGDRIVAVGSAAPAGHAVSELVAPEIDHRSVHASKEDDLQVGGVGASSRVESRRAVRRIGGAPFNVRAASLVPCRAH